MSKPAARITACATSPLFAVKKSSSHLVRDPTHALVPAPCRSNRGDDSGAARAKRLLWMTEDPPRAVTSSRKKCARWVGEQRRAGARLPWPAIPRTKRRGTNALGDVPCVVVSPGHPSGLLQRRPSQSEEMAHRKAARTKTANKWIGAVMLLAATGRVRTRDTPNRGSAHAVPGRPASTRPQGQKSQRLVEGQRKRLRVALCELKSLQFSCRSSLKGEGDEP